jgi:hypothetical protein
VLLVPALPKVLGRFSSSIALSAFLWYQRNVGAGEVKGLDKKWIELRFVRWLALAISPSYDPNAIAEPVRVGK